MVFFSPQWCCFQIHIPQDSLVVGDGCPEIDTSHRLHEDVKPGSFVEDRFVHADGSLAFPSVDRPDKLIVHKHPRVVVNCQMKFITIILIDLRERCPVENTAIALIQILHSHRI